MLAWSHASMPPLRIDITSNILYLTLPNHLAPIQIDATNFAVVGLPFHETIETRFASKTPVHKSTRHNDGYS